MTIGIGCPCVVRADRGTENCHIAAAQMALRHHHRDSLQGKNSFRYGKSTTNSVSTAQDTYPPTANDNLHVTMTCSG